MLGWLCIFVLMPICTILLLIKGQKMGLAGVAFFAIMFIFNTKYMFSALDWVTPTFNWICRLDPMTVLAWILAPFVMCFILLKGFLQAISR